MMIIQLRTLNRAESTNWRGSILHSMADLLFILFGISCFAEVEWTTILLVWSNQTSQTLCQPYSDSSPSVSAIWTRWPLVLIPSSSTCQGCHFSFARGKPTKDMLGSTYDNFKGGVNIELLQLLECVKQDECECRKYPKIIQRRHLKLNFNFIIK